MVLVSSGSIFQALGKTNYMFQAGLFSSIVTILAVSFGVFIEKSVDSVAIFILFAFIINFFQRFYLLFKKCFKINFRVFFNLLSSSIKISIILFIIYGLFNLINTSNNFIIMLLLKTAIFIVTYMVLLFSFKEFHFVKSILDLKKFRNFSN